MCIGRFSVFKVGFFTKKLCNTIEESPIQSTKQHAEVFEKRMSSFGFKVHHISRLTPKKQIDQIKKEIEDGTAKLIVGTHTILNLKFKKLAA